MLVHFLSPIISIDYMHGCMRVQRHEKFYIVKDLTQQCHACNEVFLLERFYRKRYIQKSIPKTVCIYLLQFQTFLYCQVYKSEEMLYLLTRSITSGLALIV